MIDLIEYGFVKTVETDKKVDYEGCGFTVTIYNYMMTSLDKKEVAHNVFVVNSKRFTSRARPISELADWLSENEIQKT